MCMVACSYTQVKSSHYEEEVSSPPNTWEQLEEVLFDRCSDCYKNSMSSIPPAAFAAQKVHNNMEKEKKMPVSVFRTSFMPQYPQMNRKFLEQPPAQYNSKLMNSIWGLYNRYSVHNLKKITDGEKVPLVLEAQQTLGNAEASLHGW